MKAATILGAALACLVVPLSAQTDLEPRRVVTGLSDQGRAVVVSDGAPAEVISFEALPGFVLAPMWGTGAVPKLPEPGERPTFRMGDFVPEPGGTHFLLFTVPTPGELAAAGENPDMMADLTAEMSAEVPDLVDAISEENPDLHATVSIDYVIVISGTVALELDDGAMVTLHPGDVVVQNGTRHAWHNVGEERALLAAVLVGAAGGGQ